MDNITILSGVVGVVVGLGLRILYEMYKSPKLLILGTSEKHYHININPLEEGYLVAYRVRIRNVEKWFLNQAAENCMAWIIVKDKDKEEQFQTAWVDGYPFTTINVGDTREIDFAAIGDRSGDLYLPTPKNYFDYHKSPIRITGFGEDVSIRLRITCENGKKILKPVNITLKKVRGNPEPVNQNADKPHNELNIRFQ
jgi:hypothetical protein